jgi:hypothetical protein
MLKRSFLSFIAILPIFFSFAMILFGVHFIVTPLYAQTTGPQNPMLYFTSDKSSYRIGETITLEIKMNTKEYKVTGAEIHLAYSANDLEVKSVELGTFLPVVLQSQQIAPGSISFIVGSSPQQAATGSGSLGKITFKATQASSSTILFTNSTIVTAVDYTTDILDTTTPITFTIISPVTPTPTNIPTQTPTPTISLGNGLQGTYYNNKNFTGSTITRNDAVINFDWRTQKPHPSIAADTYSVRWVGYVMPKSTDTYIFYLRADDGVRVWVNNQPIIDYWGDQAATERSGKIALTKDQKYPIKIEYYENYGNAVAQLRWSSPSTPKQLIPQANLFVAQ